ncbi:hypothetical protein LTR85_000973 [Meristemomyces frigidus]|nr:hypothetical protein LTR85_000973 [Meristemomyces frigidus]
MAAQFLPGSSWGKLVLGGSSFPNIRIEDSTIVHVDQSGVVNSNGATVVNNERTTAANTEGPPSFITQTPTALHANTPTSSVNQTPTAIYANTPTSSTTQTPTFVNVYIPTFYNTKGFADTFTKLPTADNSKLPTAIDTETPTVFSMADPQASEFPQFKDADVRIVISGSRQYQLHSSILKSISPTMKELLADQWAAKLNSKAIKRGVTGKCRLLMVENEEEADKISHLLEPVPIDEDGKPMVNNTIRLDLENGVAVVPIVLAYHSVLGAFYNIPIELGDFEADPMAHILLTASYIIDVAEYLQCVHIVTKSIEATLLAMGQLFQQAMANNPIAWLNFAYRIRSRIIFREALIHAAGKYKEPAIVEQLDTLNEAVAEVLSQKAKTLQAAMQQAEMKILSFYPTHLQREKTVGRADKDSIGRASYANDVMSWIALVVLRHFFSQNLCGDNTHNAEDMGYEMVQTIMAGGDTYLNKPMLDQFHNLFPMSRKGASVVEAKLDDMKEFIKTFDLAKNESQLDTRLYPVKHFTWTTVNIEDYPWDTGYAPPQAARESSDDEDDEEMAEGDYDGGDEESSA